MRSDDRRPLMRCAFGAALLALAGCAARPAPSSAPELLVRVADTVPEPVMRGWPAMGTTLRVIVWDADTTRALAAMEAARAAVARAEAMMSAADPASEVAAANRRAGTDSTTTLSPWTAAVLDSALAISDASGGAFDATAGPLADAWGFDRPGAVPSRAARDSLALRIGWRRVRFVRETLRLRRPARG